MSKIITKQIQGFDTTFLLDDGREIVHSDGGPGYWVRAWDKIQTEAPGTEDPDFILPWKMTLMYTIKHPDLADQPYWDGTQNVSLNAYLKDGSFIPFEPPEGWTW